MAFGLYKAQNKDWLIFLLGLLTMIKMRLLGTFGVSELIMIPMLFFIPKKEFLENKQAVTVFLLTCLWCIGNIFTDVYRGTSDIDCIKGTVSIMMMAFLIPVAYWCIKDKPERIFYFIAGLAISYSIGFFFQASENYTEEDKDVWQVYAFQYIAVYISGTLFLHKKWAYAYLTLIGYGLWSLFHMSRNVLLSNGLAACIIWYSHFIYNKTSSIKTAQNLFNKRIIILLVLLGGGIGGGTLLYESLASEGALGERARAKYEMQKNTEIGLASARGDFFITLHLIRKSPIIGYGSYAKDKNELAYKESRKLGLYHSRHYLQHKIRNHIIPGHSYILGAWVFSGILGLPIWLYALYLIFLFFKRGLYCQYSISPLLTIWSTIMIFNILFSPFQNRPIIAFFLAIILAILHKSSPLIKTLRNLQNE